MECCFSLPLVMTAPNALAVNGNDLSALHPKDPFHPGCKALLKDFCLQQAKNSSERVMRGYPTFKFQKLPQPTLFAFTKFLNVFPTFCPAQHRADGDYDDV